MTARRVLICVIAATIGVPLLIGLIALCIYGLAAPWASYGARDQAFRTVVLDPLCVRDVDAFGALMWWTWVVSMALGGMAVGKQKGGAK